MGCVADQSTPLGLWVGKQVVFMNCTKSEKAFPCLLSFDWASAISHFGPPFGPAPFLSPKFQVLIQTVPLQLMLRLESQAPTLIEYPHACISIFSNFVFPRQDEDNPVPLELLTTSELPSGFL
ncbi:hypothetical protein ACFX2F_013102 [Malus domestica]